VREKSRFQMLAEWESKSTSTMRRTVKSAIVKTAVLISHIWTDEEDLPIEIMYEYEARQGWFLNMTFSVTIIEFKVLGDTALPEDLIKDQVKEIIRDHYKGLSVEFNY
jgi:hypothetical protein